MRDGITSPHLPNNPTRSYLLEHYWYEFLLYLKNSPELPEQDLTALVREIGMENIFWTWLMQKHIPSVDQSQPEAN